ncbi:ANR family transcriptional regulator [Morganella morganii]|uniref:ANR family transcriptional regulator n=1 Tax=Morganella morganii TaxID=582 RepID=UPI001043198D|nr:ANR family transcriptional regulator [Morganella morganii]HAS8353674.1 ANR family transcriptional regulator [Vibrio vulnificus]EGT3609583.1 ANR family transcriptional regulator [Morganella morganii]EKW8487374.1 ANR family transcriptional regulator [Morganella morganii]ELA9131475.1 ANR family transcriptional regulator [Morganella morganii]MBA5852797.1 ANR family transcriptional regulator [Morganella morganii]
MSFKHYATTAATAERDGHYKEAGRNWADAAGLAKKRENQQWAERRAEFCAKAAGGRYTALISSDINC